MWNKKVLTKVLLGIPREVLYPQIFRKFSHVRKRARLPLLTGLTLSFFPTPDARRPFCVMPISQNLHTGSVGYKWIESGHPLVGRREGIFWDCWTESGASYLCSSASRSPEAHRQSRLPFGHRQSRSHYCHVSVIEASHSLTNIFLSQRCDRFYSSSNHNKRPAQAGWAGFLLKTYGRALSAYPYQL